MSDTIVVGWDGGPSGKDALVLASLLARERGSRLLAVHCHRVHGPHSHSEEELERLRRALPGDVDAEARSVAASSPAAGIRQAARFAHADVVVVGSSRHGPAGVAFPGGVGTKLLETSPCSVALAPAGYAADPADRLRVLMVAFNGSPESRGAVEVTRDWALAVGATVRLVGVSELGNAGMAARSTASFGGVIHEGSLLRDELKRSRDSLPSALRADARMLTGGAAARLADESDLGVDLLVMGSRGYGPVRRVLLGSVSASVVRRASCPVMVVPRALAKPRALDEVPPEAIRIAAPTFLG